MSSRQVHPDREDKTVTFSNAYSAMEGLYVYTANKLEAIRTGNDGKRSYKVFDVQELKSVPFWRAVGAELIAQVLFVFLGGCSAMYTGSDPGNAQIIKVSCRTLTTTLKQNKKEEEV